MPAKRKRDILEGFDPNASDPEDENFEPSEERPSKPSKKSRSSKTKRTGGKSRSRGTKYRGSDIEDDEDDDASDDDEEHSFAEDDEDGEDEEDEEDEDLPITSTGRRMRKAAVVHPSYKESSEDSDEAEAVPSDQSEEEKPAKKPSRIVVLKTGGSRSTQRGKRGKEEPPKTIPPTRRNTRARTEETEETLLELSNSGRHAQPARASRSRSPEAMNRATRATRGAKGIKKPPPPILEVSQESDPKSEPVMAVDDADELAPSDGEGQQGNDANDAETADVEAAKVSSDATLGKEPAELLGEPAEDADDDDDDDDAPITRRPRTTRGTAVASVEQAEPEAEPENGGTGRLLTRRAGLRGRKAPQEPSSDFEPGEESGDAEMSGSDAEMKQGQNGKSADDASSGSTPARGRGARSRGSRKTRRSHEDSGDEEVELDKDEMAEELEELRQSSRSRPRRRKRSPSILFEEDRTSKKRRTKPVNYSIQPIDIAALEVDEEDDAQVPAKGRRGGKGAASQVWERNFNTTYGPFGGGGGNGSLIGGPWGTGATGGVDSDSSDDEMVHRSGIGGAVGMTPTSGAPALGLFNPASASSEGMGITSNVGKMKNPKAYADADPLGVNMNVDFSHVGGLKGHVEQLKEMVMLPLLYPELFAKFHITPPRGVLFHGPPGTGKTLLARALANSVGSGGRKVTFYMRKGADALSKWVGEAEKQLRLLFEDARKNQPSIIFFDEIDGLAPVRSSKQEQIHASIVSTMLALMDGMDGRGQTIVIGATNRPDNIDPALRRPGRFDREFYFPLPDIEGRKAILDIHTQDWGLSDEFKLSLAEITKGYGGADLRALCTEAAVNAIQRVYPQIYGSEQKLLTDPAKVDITATDFMISVKKMIPSSERSASAVATPIPRAIEPLLRDQYKAILKLLDNILPRPKKATALDEAMFEQHQDSDHGFGREALHQEFERSRIYRPRLLLCGTPGMGQNYLANACLHHLEGTHVQNFDLATLLGDGRVRLSHFAFDMCHANCL
jgi:ATPase family AAA domain-containing protein 2